MPADFVFENHGSVWLVRPQHKTARDHLEDNVGEEAQWWGSIAIRALVVEPRYVNDLAEKLVEAGFSVEGPE
jgi:hypothetical protein